MGMCMGVEHRTHSDHGGCGACMVYAEDALSLMKYPMFVVPCGEFMRMTQARPHQELMTSGVAVRVADMGAVVVFVSHEWASGGHPDPEFKQLSVLQAFIQSAQQRPIRAGMDMYTRAVFGPRGRARSPRMPQFDDCLIWYDYFSVPQPDADGVVGHQRAALQADQASAVRSIPGYIEAATLFIVLAPDLDRADSLSGLMGYRSWKGRGWCRFERMAHVLSKGCVSMLLVRGAQEVDEMGPNDWLFDAVGTGSFTKEGDKIALREVLEKLIDRKLSRLLHSGDLNLYRQLKARRTLLLQGLPVANGHLGQQRHAAGGSAGAGGDAAAAFCKSFAFAGRVPRARRHLGEALLHAALAGNVAAVHGLLDARADVRYRARANADFMVTRGCTAMHIAAQTGHTSAMAALLERRATVEDRNANGGTPLFFAAMNSSPAAVRFLLQRRADVHVTQVLGTHPLNTAAIFGRADSLDAMLDAGARPDHPFIFLTRNDGIVDRLLAARADPNSQWHPSECSLFLRFLVWVNSLPHRLCASIDRVPRVCFHAPGATSLHLCAMLGQVEDTRTLVEAGARLDTKNDRGATAEDLAAAFHFSPAHLSVFRGRA